MPASDWTDFADFLANGPPGTTYECQMLDILDGNSRLIMPPLRMYCDSDECQKVVWFDTTEEYAPNPNGSVTLEYRCRLCQKKPKIFALYVLLTEAPIQVIKFGELPPFGPPVPSKMLNLIGPDRDLFLKGRRAENQGMGVGAFAYYRRVVENQKGRLFDAIIESAKESNADPALIAQLEAAKKEKQFTKAIEQIKPGIPENLKFGDHNPLALLHDALSDGLHAQTDEACLEWAKAIRTVLIELSERMAQLRESRNQMQAAVAAIQNRSQKQAKP